MHAGMGKDALDDASGGARAFGEQRLGAYLRRARDCLGDRGKDDDDDQCCEEQFRSCVVRHRAVEFGERAGTSRKARPPGESRIVTRQGRDRVRARSRRSADRAVPNAAPASH
jgi:hypothetical protein